MSLLGLRSASPRRVPAHDSGVRTTPGSAFAFSISYCASGGVHLTRRGASNTSVMKCASDTSERFTYENAFDTSDLQL